MQAWFPTGKLICGLGSHVLTRACQFSKPGLSTFTIAMRIGSLWVTTIMCTHIFGLNFQEKNILFQFLIQLFYFYLGTCFLHYKGILEFIFEHIMVQ